MHTCVAKIEQTFARSANAANIAAERLYALSDLWVTKTLTFGRPLHFRSYEAIPRPRNLSEFVTTNTLEKAIAAAANIGSRPPSIATGISTIL